MSHPQSSIDGAHFPRSIVYEGPGEMIKYIGSKRRLVPVLGGICESAKAETALDLFTGTTRVAQEFKRRGARVTAVDTATYAHVFAQCYIESDAASVDMPKLEAAIEELNGLSGSPGYFTETFCIQSRYFHPKNGAMVDVIRDALADRYGSSPLFPILLTSLIEAADRVDSTTGLQMAFLKQWAPRAHNDLKLRVPDLLRGSGVAVQGDALELARHSGPFDLAYLDPPYNQHRYFTNYHIWETLVRWDAPEFYGIACKRIDSREDSTKSPFNAKRGMPVALREVVKDVDCRVMVLSYNDESWVSLEELLDMCSARGAVEVLAFDSKRYVGAQIGIYNPSGSKVGEVSHLRNQEYIVVAGDPIAVEKATAPFAGWSTRQEALF
jgi:adenine-specific DNA-methyltransferase